MEKISVFDIFKISVGPSSSHTMGPWLAANAFLKKIKDKKVSSLKVQLFGSLAKTGKGHGTDIAIMLGLSGYDIETIDVKKINEYVAQIKTSKQITNGKQVIPFDPATDIEFVFKNLPKHPNALTFRAIVDSNKNIEATFYSIGGGFILEEGVDPKKEKKDRKKLPYPIENAHELIDHIQKTGLSISDIVLKNELTWRDKKTIHKKLDKIWQVMLECIYRGAHTPGVLPGGLNVQRRAAGMNDSLLSNDDSKTPEEWIKKIKKSEQNFSNIIKWVSCFALAVNEENASYGRVVTSPTNGAAGVIPAVLLYFLCFCENEEEDIYKFLLTAAEIGSLFKMGATISAAMGGCQAEIGVSSAMAAAGLTACLGGTDKQAMMAAEIAMEHHLGLTCDPINGLVQIPCIERNTMGAIKAITASEIALSSDPEKAKVSLESVIETMRDTALDMKDKYKETAEGGLAVHVSVNIPEC